MNKRGDYLNLYVWWKEQLTDTERYILNHSYRPMGGNSNAEQVFINFRDQGYEFSSADPVQQLCSFVDYVVDFDFKLKILKKAEQICEEFSYISRHFLYILFIKYYDGRKGFKNYGTLYYEYCNKAVLIADSVKNEMLKEFPTLPAHIGFDGVFEELVNLERYKEAISLIIDAREKGWNISYLIDECWNVVKEYNLDPDEFGLKEANDYYSREEIDSNPFLKIKLVLEEIKEKADSDEAFNIEADEVLACIDKNCLKNYLSLEAFFTLGTLFYKKGDKMKGLEILERIKSSIQEISPITISNFYSEIGKLLYSKGDYQLALEWLKNGTELNKKLAIKKLIKQIEEKISAKDGI